MSRTNSFLKVEPGVPAGLVRPAHVQQPAVDGGFHLTFRYDTVWDRRRSSVRVFVSRALPAAFAPRDARLGEEWSDVSPPIARRERATNSAHRSGPRKSVVERLRELPRAAALALLPRATDARSCARLNRVPGRWIDDENRGSAEALHDAIRGRAMADQLFRSPHSPRPGLRGDVALHPAESRRKVALPNRNRVAVELATRLKT